jgi:DNA-binding CsgD family transcriptional regulator
MADRAKAIDDILVRVATVATSEELRQVAFEYFLSFGSSLISYIHLPPLGAQDMGRVLIETEGFPPELVERYHREKLFLIDPIPIYAQKTASPFRWSEISRLTNLRPDQKDLLRAFREAGLGEGYVFQVFGPGGRNGVFGLGFSDSRRILKRPVVREIHWICQAFHLRYCEILEKRFPEFIGLSKRESEVLEWVARGKSNADIAAIMGVSSHTVDAYLRRIFLKLGTTDRVTAAIRAVGTGMLTGLV